MSRGLVSDHPSQVIHVGYNTMKMCPVKETLPAENQFETILRTIIQRICKCRGVGMKNQAS